MTFSYSNKKKKTVGLNLLSLIIVPWYDFALSYKKKIKDHKVKIAEELYFKKKLLFS